MDSLRSAPHRTLAALDRDECLELLASVPVGQVVFSFRALPEILPVNFRVDGESVVMRVASGSALARVADGTVLAFHADRVDESERSGWSVTVVGRVSEVTDEAEQDRIRALPLESWMSDARDHFLRIDAERVTGRRLE
ncbi:pyridoxamine 5'-phosphate oxidase family protein [Cryptosporangium aurantiacum]|uniref:Pyridoxamine 5'-phosphate oxidase n=1 Tax=Cryptosporangium aurantiacum TaxID=134849 RepID=A0A1M7MHN6_9ACTN|nr:pyridoxamine 5'-phosphate oxidase family protein [Cryptosporangium aurantiacum]SHM90407.1 Pyridoxamine 5'-phosphate oxidase [Cryptosporangium aurantiacum]